jgi:hypothetical protein
VAALVQLKSTYSAKGWWFDKLTTNGLRFTRSGLNPFALSLSKGISIAKEVF